MAHIHRFSRGGVHTADDGNMMAPPRDTVSLRDVAGRCVAVVFGSPVAASCRRGRSGGDVDVEAYSSPWVWPARVAVFAAVVNLGVYVVTFGAIRRGIRSSMSEGIYPVGVALFAALLLAAQLEARDAGAAAATQTARRHWQRLRAATVSSRANAPAIVDVVAAAGVSDAVASASGGTGTADPGSRGSAAAAVVYAGSGSRSIDKGMTAEEIAQSRCRLPVLPTATFRGRPLFATVAAGLSLLHAVVPALVRIAARQPTCASSNGDDFCDADADADGTMDEPDPENISGKRVATLVFGWTDIAAAYNASVVFGPGADASDGLDMLPSKATEVVVTVVASLVLCLSGACIICVLDVFVRYSAALSSQSWQVTRLIRDERSAELLSVLEPERRVSAASGQGGVDSDADGGASGSRSDAAEATAAGAPPLPPPTYGASSEATAAAAAGGRAICLEESATNVSIWLTIRSRVHAAVENEIRRSAFVLLFVLFAFSTFVLVILVSIGHSNNRVHLSLRTFNVLAAFEAACLVLPAGAFCFHAASHADAAAEGRRVLALSLMHVRLREDLCGGGGGRGVGGGGVGGGGGDDRRASGDSGPDANSSSSIAADCDATHDAKGRSPENPFHRRRMIRDALTVVSLTDDELKVYGISLTKAKLTAVALSLVSGIAATVITLLGLNVSAVAPGGG